jgi:hypothetical protein
MPDPMSRSPLAEPLIRIGDIAVARENDAALDAYFASDFVLHGPGGDLTYGQLKAYFAALRAAATFGSGEPRSSAKGPILQPGPSFPEHSPAFSPSRRWDPCNDDGRLAEEWVQYDYRSFLQKLGAA